MTFRMYAKIKMNRPINRNNFIDHISPGGYTIKSNGKEYSFDFMDYEGVIDHVDRSILHASVRNPDYDSYPDIEEITAETLRSISEFSEFFVYTGEMNETDLQPVELLECQFWIIDTDETIIVPNDVCKRSHLCSNAG